MSERDQARADLAAANAKIARLQEYYCTVMGNYGGDALAEARADLAARDTFIEGLKIGSAILRADLATRDELLKEARELRYQPNGKATDALFARIDAALKGDDNGQ